MMTRTSPLGHEDNNKNKDIKPLYVEAPYDDGDNLSVVDGLMENKRSSYGWSSDPI
jgi:hypothetical protein